MTFYQADWKRIDVVITWDTPITIEDAITIEDENDTYLYKIIGRYNESYKLFYIGKCVEQKFTTRIFQKDHQIKQAAFKEAHKKHKLMVSMGRLKEEKKHKPTEISNVESLLIFAHSHDGYPYIKNKQCSLSHNVIKNYKITNRGWRKDKMYQTVAYGLFMKD
jgi:hypothetical protein